MKTVSVLSVLAVIILLVATLVAPASASGIESSVRPIESYFESPATDNGRRRFLAVGNFYDTTNGAYFRDSKAYLRFDLPDWGDVILDSAKLKLNKYANSASSELVVSVRSGDQTAATDAASVADLDNQWLAADLYSLVVGNIESDALNLELSVASPDYREGLALCSGNVIDVVCPSENAPHLELRYRSNTYGELVSSMVPEDAKYNSISKTDTAHCGEDIGCRFSVLFDYQDLEGNGTASLVAKNTLTGEEFIDEVRNVAGLKTLEMQLSDGSYEWTAQLQDGQRQMAEFRGSLSLDTQSPDPPVVFYTGEQIARSGLAMVFKPASDRDSIELKQGTQIENFSDTEYQYIPTQTLTTAEEYEFRLRARDDHGNYSKELTFAKEFSGNLVELSEQSLSSPVISPSNQDGKYDATVLDYESSEELLATSLVVFDSSYRKLGEMSGDTFSGELSGGNLEDGIYHLKLAGEDQHGYPPSDMLPLKVIIDNRIPTFTEI